MPGGITPEIAGAASALADAIAAVPAPSADAATPNNAGSTSMGFLPTDLCDETESKGAPGLRQTGFSVPGPRVPEGGPSNCRCRVHRAIGSGRPTSPGR